MTVKWALTISDRWSCQYNVHSAQIRVLVSEIFGPYVFPINDVSFFRGLAVCHSIGEPLCTSKKNHGIYGDYRIR